MFGLILQVAYTFHLKKSWEHLQIQSIKHFQISFFITSKPSYSNKLEIVSITRQVVIFLKKDLIQSPLELTSNHSFIKVPLYHKRLLFCSYLNNTEWNFLHDSEFSSPRDRASSLKYLLEHQINIRNAL